jgi:hypothetical protein
MKLKVYKVTKFIKFKVERLSTFNFQLSTGKPEVF